jgi:hypothetical protein
MTMALVINGTIEQVGVPADLRGTDISQLTAAGWVKVQGSEAPTDAVEPGYYHAFGVPYAYADGVVTGTWSVQKRPQPYPSWTWVDGQGWVAPVPMPTDGKDYNWDEATQSWVEITVE